MVAEFKTRKRRIARGVLMLAAAAMLATFTRPASAHDDDHQGWYRPREHDWHSGWHHDWHSGPHVGVHDKLHGIPITAGTTASTTVPTPDATTTGTMARTTTGMAEIPDD